MPSLHCTHYVLCIYLMNEKFGQPTAALILAPAVGLGPPYSEIIKVGYISRYCICHNILWLALFPDTVSVHNILLTDRVSLQNYCSWVS